MSLPQLVGVAFGTLPIEVESIPHAVRVVVPAVVDATASPTPTRKPPLRG